MIHGAIVESTNERAGENGNRIAQTTYRAVSIWFSLARCGLAWRPIAPVETFDKEVKTDDLESQSH